MGRNSLFRLGLASMVHAGILFLGASCFTVTRLNLRQKRLGMDLKSVSRPSVAVVGSGAVGGYYGARLWESRADVKFFMRGDHFDVSQATGLNVTSVYGDIFIPPAELQAFDDTKDIGTVDWVIVAVKSTALDLIPSLISPLLQPDHTRVLAIMNGLIEEDLIQALKSYHNESNTSGEIRCCGALYGGMALVCSNRLGPGRIDHTYAGLLSSGVAIQSPAFTAAENKEAFENLWDPVQIETAYEPSLLGGRWRKVRRRRCHSPWPYK